MHGDLDRERMRARIHTDFDVRPARGTAHAHIGALEPGPNLAGQLFGIEAARPNRPDCDGHGFGTRPRNQGHRNQGERQASHRSFITRRFHRISDRRKKI